MSQRLDSIVKTFFDKTSLHELTIEDVKQAQAKYPYASIFSLLGVAHHINNDEGVTKWSDAYVHANDLLWWQYIMLYTDENLNFEQMKSEDDATIEQEVVQQVDGTNTVEIFEKEVLDESIELGEEKAPEAITETLSKIKESFEAPIDGAHVWVDLEPYHTVDYFASQGIKITNELEPKDKLSRQLKSFTAWLKTMKRIGPTSESLSIDDETEQQVMNEAAQSVAKEDVVTEAMADVLQKQGKINKAIGVYQQLISLYPEKSNYFAEKIQQLKQKS